MCPCERYWSVPTWQEDACEIVLEGADRGTPQEEPLPPHPISYAWSLPRAKAFQQEVLIAYRMNGRDLPRDHGYPVRAIVPGHYGMASVKWLTHIHAVREPFRGYWQTSDYAYWDSIGWKAGAATIGRNEAQVRNCPTTCLRNHSPEPYLSGVRCCMGGRDRRDRDRSEHRWWANLGRGRIPRPCATACVATLEIRLAYAEGTGTVHATGPREGRGR